MSKAFFRGRHNLCSQPYKRKVLCARCNIRYGDFSSHRVLNIKSFKFIITMQCSTSLSDDYAPSEMFQTQDIILA